MQEEKQVVDFKKVIKSVKSGDREVFGDLITYHDAHVKFLHHDYYTNESQSNAYLKRDFEFNIVAINKKYHFCLNYFGTKLDRQDINELFITGLYDFILIASEDSDFKNKSNGELINWFKIFIEKYILKYIEGIFGKIKIDKDTGEIKKETELISDAISYKQYANGVEQNSIYDKQSFDEWDKKSYGVGFGSFLDDVDLEHELNEILTPIQLNVYQGLIKKYSINNQKEYGYSHIAKELNISESRVRQIEKNEIINKLKKLYELWYATKCQKDTPLSHEIRDFFKIYNSMVQYSDDLDTKFNLLISWLKMMVGKMNEHQESFYTLHKNKKETGLNIVDLIVDNSQLGDIIHELDNKLHVKTYNTLMDIITGKQDDSKLRKNTKQTIVTKLENILFTYLTNIDKDINTIKKYVATYRKKQEQKYDNKRDLSRSNFNKTVNL